MFTNELFLFCKSLVCYSELLKAFSKIGILWTWASSPFKLSLVVFKVELHSLACVLKAVKSYWVVLRVSCKLAKFCSVAAQLWLLASSWNILSRSYWLLDPSDWSWVFPDYNYLMLSYKSLLFLFKNWMLAFNSFACIFEAFNSFAQVSICDWSWVLIYSNYCWAAWLLLIVFYKPSMVLVKFRRALFWASS